MLLYVPFLYIVTTIENVQRFEHFFGRKIENPKPKRKHYGKWKIKSR